MRRHVLPMLIVAAFVCAAIPASASDGEDLYGFNCASCHEAPARDALGAPDLRGGLPDFGVFTDTVRVGRGVMPSFSAGVISDAELEEIYLYLSAG